MIPHFDLVELIQTVGYVGVTFIVFAESGLFFGFFLPGDSLLFTAGFIASQGYFNVWLLLALLMVAAIAGDSVGYWTGRKFGSWLEKREDSFFFKKKHLKKAQRFYEKNGAKTIVMARFIPIVRTFAPIAGGMAKMHYRTFLSFNIVGGVFWVSLMVLLGYFLGNVIPDVDKYLLPIVGVIIFISVIPAITHMRDDEDGDAKGFSPLFRAKLWVRNLLKK